MENSNGDNKNHFNIHASIIFQLGESLISDPVQALVEFEAIIDEYSKYSDKKYEENFLKKYLLPKSPAYGKTLFTPELQFDRENKKSTIKYNCKRVNRLCKQHAEAILLKYSHYISRSAFEHDFGREGKLE